MLPVASAMLRVGGAVVEVDGVAVGADRVAAGKRDVADVALALVGRLGTEDPRVAAQRGSARGSSSVEERERRGDRGSPAAVWRTP